MDYMETWNKICELFEQHRISIEKTLEETLRESYFGIELNTSPCADKIQRLWEYVFSEYLGYSKLYGEIYSEERPRTDSSERAISDIFLKKDDKKLFIVELMRTDLPASETFKQEATSYLKQQDLHIGIIIDNKILIINSLDNTTTEIYFYRENPDGAKFVELFYKENFNEDEIKEFIVQKNHSSQNIKKLHEELINSKDLIIKLLKNEFTKKYDTMEFYRAINEFQIRIVKTSDILGRLKKDIRLVGMSRFARYYEQFANPNFSAEYVKQIMKDNDEYCSDKIVSVGKKITNYGYGEKALQLIANKNETDVLDELVNDILVVGMPRFVRYYEQFANSNFSVKDIKQIMKDNNECCSYETVSVGKWIIKNGYGEKALQLIATSSATREKTKQKARALLSMPQPLSVSNCAKKNSMNFHGKANRRIPKWAMAPCQYNHKIIRAFFMVEDIVGEYHVTLDRMKALCSDKNRFDVYVPTFMSNYRQMTYDNSVSHGKVFENDGEFVIIWEEVKDTLLKYKSMFYEKNERG